MKEAAGSAATLHAALLDYFGAPGKYQLGLRQPALLFSSIREILQLAAGRGAPAAGEDPERLRDAAAFFIRAALLFPGADHYAVLGLPTAQEPADLKDRYRLLMRLTHPDFMPSGSAAWPADAAVRVNRAYEVLSSPTLRREYDEQLATLRSQRPSATRVPPAAGARPGRRVAPHLGHHARPRFGAKAGWALGLGSVIAVGLLVWPRTDADHLVQRSKRPAAPPVAEQATPPLPAPMPAASEPEALAGLPVPAPATAEVVVVPAGPLPAIPAPTAAGTNPLQLQAAPSASAQVPAIRPALAVVPPAPPAVAVAPGNFALAPPNPAAARPRAATERPAAITLATHDEPSVPPALPSPPPVSGSAVAAATVPAPPALSAAPATARLSTPAASALASPTLGDAQPLLTQLLQMLETGSGEQLLRLLEADARKQPAAVALSRHYEQMVRGGRPIRLSQVEFKGEPRDGVLLVTGRIHMHAGEPTIGSHGERLVLRAEFAHKGGRVQLTGLSGAAD